MGSPVNGIPYPYSVKDMDTFQAWLKSIDREVSQSNSADADGHGGKHKELYHRVMFKDGDEESFNIARKAAFQFAALEMFVHLVNAPNGVLNWRVPIEIDITPVAIPSDLSRYETRAQAEKRVFGSAVPNVPISLEKMLPRNGELWGVNFSTDTIFPMAAPFGDWKLFKVYARYSVLVDGKVVEA